MARYIVINTIRGLLTLVAVSIIVFALARLTGNPLDVLAPVDMGPADQAALAAKWGLDEPLDQHAAAQPGHGHLRDRRPAAAVPVLDAGYARHRVREAGPAQGPPQAPGDLEARPQAGGHPAADLLRADRRADADRGHGGGDRLLVAGSRPARLRGRQRPRLPGG